MLYVERSNRTEVLLEAVAERRLPPVEQWSPENVDDSRMVRRLSREILEGFGYQVTEAEDGAEALARVKAGGLPDLITLDWNMPNMNGLDFLAKVRETKGKELPVIMITTEAEKANVITAIKAGANNYIVKPFTPEVLSEKIGPFLK